MKNIAIKFLFFSAAILLVSCNLDLYPETGYNEKNVDIPDGGGSDAGVKYQTRAEMLGAYQSVYNSFRGFQEAGLLDILVMTEVHADNAYSGTTGIELSSIEEHTQDGSNKNIARDWSAYIGQIGVTNNVICNIDSVPDPTLTAAERQQWKAEALCYRAYLMFTMARIWGAIPIIIEQPKSITPENVEEVYPLYFPARKPMEEVYTQIILDLNEALKPGGVPANNPLDKFKFSKSFANGMLARIYAEETDIRDYSLAIQYCDAVIADGFQLEENYETLFGYDATAKDTKSRNSKESIFEITYPINNGNWLTWMFGIDLNNANSTYDWAKWITPSRSLIRAFEAENDNIRMNQAIVWGQPGWSNHYPSDHYPFMYKVRSAYSSFYIMRLADILLLKAEAMVALNTDLGGAADIVDRIRDRVKLPKLSAATRGSQTAMKAAVLKERRLELAFEMQRWFDLLRTGEVFNVIDNISNPASPLFDEGHGKVNTPLTENGLWWPIPQVELDKNPSLTQNPGY